jgi:PhnB protein
MPTSPPPGFPRITPYLLYEDVPSALEWLTSAFGFKERLRFTAEDGTVNHAEMEYGDGVIMLGDPGGQFRNPKRSGAVTVQLHVYVDDVDGHCRHARQAGARIVREPENKEYGDRSYSAEDLEGHWWTFSEHVKDVRPSDWGAQGGATKA